jgi:sulfur carrier protein
MKIILNGKPFTYEGRGNLPDLIREIKADPAKVAVIVNDKIIPRASHPQFLLHENDKVEIITFAGGG